MKVDEITSFLQQEDDDNEADSSDEEDDDEKSSEEEGEGGSVYTKRVKFFTGAVKIETRNEDEDKDEVVFGYPSHLLNTLARSHMHCS